MSWIFSKHFVSSNSSAEHGCHQDTPEFQASLTDDEWVLVHGEEGNGAMKDCHSDKPTLNCPVKHSKIIKKSKSAPGGFIETDSLNDGRPHENFVNAIYNKPSCANATAFDSSGPPIVSNRKMRKQKLLQKKCYQAGILGLDSKNSRSRDLAVN